MIEALYIDFYKHSDSCISIFQISILAVVFYPSGEPICFVTAYSQYNNTASYATPRISTRE